MLLFFNIVLSSVGIEGNIKREMGFLKSIIGVKECYRFTWEKKSNDKTGRKGSPFFHLFFGGKLRSMKIQQFSSSLSFVCEKVLRMTSPVGWSKSDRTEAPVQ